MPIEIRELVIKATVHKPVKDLDKQSITRRDIHRIRKELLEACREEIQRHFEKMEQR